MDRLLTLLRRIALAGAMTALGLVASTTASAQAVSEPAVKAAYLFKFAGYVEWPASQATAEAPFVIAVVGAEDVAAELERLVPGRTIHGRRIVVRRVRDPEGVKAAQLLFIGRGEGNGAVREHIRAAQRQGTVTVTDTDRGLEQGSVINLVSLEDRVVFEVSLEAAERTGVVISSRMLSVARRVVPKA